MPSNDISTSTSSDRTTLPDIFDFDVVDNTDEKIGTINNLWPDPEGREIAFIGVRTGWLFGKDHVVPADDIEVDTERRVVRLPLPAKAVKDAPDFDVDDDILYEESARIRQYYGYNNRRYGAEAPGATTQPGQADLPETSSPTTQSDRDITEAEDVPTSAARSTQARSTPGETVEVPIREENIKIGKREVPGGGVRLRKIVRNETVHVPVELRREDVVVERVPAGEVIDANREIKEDEVYVSTSREEPVVEKIVEVTGAVRVRKTRASRTENVQDTVRKEDVQVERDADLDERQNTSRK